MATLPPDFHTLQTNRRFAARTALRTPATVLLPGGQSRDVRMWDLALDGASLLSPRPIPQGSNVELRLALPAGGAEMTAAARVVYSSYLAPGEFKVGLMFTALDAASATAIQDFMV